MTATSRKPFDFFIATPERSQDRAVTTDVTDDAISADLDKLFYPDSTHDNLGNKKKTAKEAKANAIITGPWQPNNQPEALGGARDSATRFVLRHDRWLRARAAVAGAVLVIGPMWLLVLERSLYVHLGAVTGFVSVFGCMMIGFVGSTEQVFATTLAYAAILMVFVGVSLDRLFPGD